MTPVANRRRRGYGALHAFERTSRPAAAETGYADGHHWRVPEGHVIHRLATRHHELFVGRRVRVSSPQGRFADGASAVDGKVLTATSAIGKHLLHHYGDDLAVHVHLGLYGRFTDGTGRPPPIVGEVRLRMTGNRRWLDLRGPAACEVLDPIGIDTLRARLGPDPLNDDSDPARAYEKISRSTRPIASVLLDQSVIAGGGLIFVLETLFRAGIRPTAPARTLTPAAWRQLWTDLRELMKEAVVEGRIDTVHSAHTPEAMGRPPRVDRHGGEVYVYRRTGQPCLVCGTPVRTAPLAGRNSYWCPVCQPLPG
jgi:endonuclease VIII